MAIIRPARSTALPIFLVGLALVVGLFFGNNAGAKSPDYRQLRLFRDVMGIVQKNYVKEVTDKEAEKGPEKKSWWKFGE